MTNVLQGAFSLAKNALAPVLPSAIPGKWDTRVDHFNERQYNKLICKIDKLSKLFEVKVYEQNKNLRNVKTKLKLKTKIIIKYRYHEPVNI